MSKKREASDPIQQLADDLAQLKDDFLASPTDEQYGRIRTNIEDQLFRTWREAILLRIDFVEKKNRPGRQEH